MFLTLLLLLPFPHKYIGMSSVISSLITQSLQHERIWI
jgi:hypothetical protein